jgi:hypothetical protein
MGNNLLTARQSACSESEPGRVDQGVEQHGRGLLRGKIVNPARALEELRGRLEAGQGLRFRDTRSESRLRCRGHGQGRTRL